MGSRKTIEIKHGVLVTAAGFDDTEMLALIDKAQEANSVLYAAELRIYNAVTQLRKIGASWAVIGNILGMTRGGAQKRFGTPRPVFIFDPEDAEGKEALWWPPNGPEAES